jgi:tripeptidyl-peptidase I
MFAVQLQNIDELTSILHDVSDPKSDNYGHYLTKQEVVNLTSNPVANRKIREYIEQSGATYTHETDGGDFLFATGPIKIWEEMFDTQFFVFHHVRSENGPPSKIVRAVEYSVPTDLHEYVASVFHTVDMPMMYKGPVISPEEAPPIDLSINALNGNISSLAALTINGYITPAVLKSFYNVDNSIGSADATQLVYQSISEYYSPADLAKFQSSFNLLPGTVYNNAGHNSDAQCNANYDTCLEGSLDIQYLMGMSQTSPTYFMVDTTGGYFSAYLAQISSMASPPLVISVRYIFTCFSLSNVPLSPLPQNFRALYLKTRELLDEYQV